jgi:hypothetical protein
MTQPDSGKDTRLVPVHGRNIVVRQLQDAQLVLLAREARLAQRDDTDSGRRMTAVARAFDILESAIVQESDRDYILDLTVKGQLTLEDLLGFITAFESEQDEKPRVRRGRPAKRT